MAAVQTLSQHVYDTKVSHALQIQPVRKTIPLGDLRIVNTGVIHIKDKPVAMNRNAFSQLAKILGVPIQFQGRVDKFFGEEATSQIVNRMKSALVQQGMSTITMVANPKEKQIIGFLKRESQYISNGTFFGVANDIINDHNLLVRDFSIDGDNGGITLNCFNPKAGFQIGDFQDEFFQGGITLSNSIDKGIIVSPYMNRLVCLNGMIGDSFGEAYKLKGLGSYNMEELRNHLDSLKKRNYKPFAFEERVNKAMKTNCSYAELEAAAELIMGVSGAKMDEISKWVPIQETNQKYMNFGILPGTLSAEKKKNAKTGTSVWDMVNGLTHFATHESVFKVSDDGRARVQKEAGKIMAGTYDMENLVISPYN
jgi:hypothetical protein